MNVLASRIKSVSNHFDQFIIYGANGWLGRSTLKVLRDLGVKSSSLLLVGSNSKYLQFEDSTYEILDVESAFPRILENSIFFNYAFLRREKLQEVSETEYIKKNLKIMEFSKAAIESNKLRSLINSSSGVAASIDIHSQEPSDEYSSLKLHQEKELLEICLKNSTNLINCRIYSITGNFINEFQNLAISNFVRDAFTKKKIQINSPQTLRTFIDASDLSKVMLSLSMENENISIDSGGYITSMEELANLVASNFDKTIVTLSADQRPRNDYYGNFQGFNQIAMDLGIELLGLEKQIKLTCEAIVRALRNH